MRNDVSVFQTCLRSQSPNASSWVTEKFLVTMTRKGNAISCEASKSTWQKALRSFLLFRGVWLNRKEKENHIPCFSYPFVSSSVTFLAVLVLICVFLDHCGKVVFWGQWCSLAFNWFYLDNCDMNRDWLLYICEGEKKFKVKKKKDHVLIVSIIV